MGAADARAAYTYVVTDVRTWATTTRATTSAIRTPTPGEQCSLRAAIRKGTRTQKRPDHFTIPGDGVQKIVVAGPDLPTINTPVEIEGYTQPGASPNTNPDREPLNTKIMVELSGSGIFFGLGSTDSAVRGLAIGGGSGGVQALQVDSVSVQGCFLGTNAKGTKARPNGFGFYSQYPGFLGGSDPEDRNLVSGNDGTGVSMNPSNIAIGNYIGTEADGRSPLPNAGDGIFEAGDGLVQQNIIAFNEDDGVYAPNTDDHNSLLTRNLIYRNGGQAIDLGPDDGRDQNDPLDVDVGFQNYPVIKSVDPGKNKTVVEFKLNSLAATEFDIEFFSGERKKADAKRFLGTAEGLTTDAQGNVSGKFTITKQVKRGDRITATAIDVAALPVGNTSELSKPVKVK